MTQYILGFEVFLDYKNGKIVLYHLHWQAFDQVHDTRLQGFLPLSLELSFLGLASFDIWRDKLH